LTGADRARVANAVPATHDRSDDIIGTAVANGHTAFSDYSSSGGMERARDTRQWYVDHGNLLRQALT
jgi:hypothetical protein